MKIATLLIAGMVLTTVAMADDVDDVKAAVQRLYAAMNTGDAGAMVQHLVAGRTDFTPDGGLLKTSDSLEEQRKAFQASVDAGYKRNFQTRHIDVRVYGNSTAVATYYWVGTITNPQGTTVQVNNRSTVVWVKQGGQWKAVHSHFSPLRLPQ